MARGPAVAVVLAAWLAWGGSSGGAPEAAPAPEPHAGDATANLPSPSPTAAAVPDAPPVIGPGLRRRDTSATRLETEAPRHGGERPIPGAHERNLGTGSPAQGASRATTDRLPQPPDPVLDIAASPAARAGAAPEASLQACVDRELTARGLNGFGDPPATEYPGGTPVDASSITRYDYVLRRSAGIRTACEATTPFR